MENREVTELLRKIEENSRKQLRANRILCVLVVICALSCIAMGIWISGIVPQVEGILDQMSGIMSQMEAVLENLETATDQLASLDLEGMVKDVDGLVISAQKTMEGINHIDYETLNQAIEDLAAVIEPLARWFR